MSTTLQRSPLRMSPSATAGHHEIEDRLAELPQPLAYLYAERTPHVSHDPLDRAQYDPVSQTLIYREGAMTPDDVAMTCSFTLPDMA